MPAPTATSRAPAITQHLNLAKLAESIREEVLGQLQGCLAEADLAKVRSISGTRLAQSALAAQGQTLPNNKDAPKVGDAVLYLGAPHTITADGLTPGTFNLKPDVPVPGKWMPRNVPAAHLSPVLLMPAELSRADTETLAAFALMVSAGLSVHCGKKKTVFAGAAGIGSDDVVIADHTDKAAATRFAINQVVARIAHREQHAAAVVTRVAEPAKLSLVKK